MSERSITISTTLYESELREIDAIRDSLPPDQQTRPGAFREMLRAYKELHSRKKRTPKKDSKQ